MDDKLSGPPSLHSLLYKHVSNVTVHNQYIFTSLSFCYLENNPSSLQTIIQEMRG